MDRAYNEYLYAQKHISKKDIRLMRYFIEKKLIPYIKKIQKQNPNLTIEEYEKLLHDDAANFAHTAFESVNSFDYYMQYICCQYLIQNPKLSNKLYEKFDGNQLSYNENRFFSSINHSFDDYITRYMHYIVPYYQNDMKDFKRYLESDPVLKELSKILDDTSPEGSDKHIKYTNAKKFINRIRNGAIKLDLMENINYYINGFNSYLPKDQKSIENDLKNILSCSISETAKKISSLGLIEDYEEKEELILKKSKHEDLILSGKKHPDITNPELLKNLPIHTLMIYNSYFINRYAKTLSKYCNGMFTINTLNLLPSILDNTCHLNNRYIREALTKCEMLRNHSQLFFEQRKKEFMTGTLPSSMYEISDNKNYVTYSFIPFAKKMISIYGNENYKKIFNDIPGDTDISKDALLYGKLSSPVFNIYSTKNEILDALFCNLNNNKEIVNAGIIPDSVSPDGTQITINSDFVCIGVDSQYLNRRITLHDRSSNLQDFLNQIYNNYAFIPLYEGNKDFTYPNGEPMTNPIIYPFTKDEKKLVVKLAASHPEDAFYQHLLWIEKPSKVPDKYMASYVDFKGRTKKIFKRRYINWSEFEPGKPLTVYIHNEKGQHIPVAESGFKFPPIDTTIPIISKIGDERDEF